MKKLLLLIAAISILGSNVIAQTVTIERCGTEHCSNDLQVVVAAMSVGCFGPMLGYSNPIPLNSITVSTTFDYNSIASTVGWAQDPGPSGCGPWYFGEAKVYNCVSTPPSGSPMFCTIAAWNEHTFTICGPGLLTSCFEYSDVCTDCGTNQVVDATFEVYNVECLDSKFTICD